MESRPYAFARSIRAAFFALTISSRTRGGFPASRFASRIALASMTRTPASFLRPTGGDDSGINSVAGADGAGAGSSAGAGDGAGSGALSAGAAGVFTGGVSGRAGGGGAGVGGAVGGGGA